GVLHHFAFSSIGCTQNVNVPFPVTVAAKDYFEGLATNFSGSARLSTDQAGTNLLGRFGSTVNFETYNGDYTLGFTFRPNKDVVVTALRALSGVKVTLWTEAG